MMTEDQLLETMVQASSLQQAGDLDAAIAVYRMLWVADPDGQYGATARKALEGLEALPEAAESPVPIPPEPLDSLLLMAEVTGAKAGLRGWLQPLANLPIRRKQVLGLVAAEVISVMGLVGVGATLLTAGLRSQLLEQAKSELKVAELQYNLKIDQMGFGFRGQSDNPAVIEAAETGQASAQLLAILKNETQARKIEYATLVDAQGKIVANANANRRGEKFDPDQLVTAVLSRGEQIKATTAIAPSELQREEPPLPEGLEQEDLLVRYVVTPVRNPDTQKIIGALVAGDLVNGKSTIVEATVNTFGQGYSAIYLPRLDGTFEPSTSFFQAGSRQTQAVELKDDAFLARALAAGGTPVTQRIRLEGQPYTVAARAIQNAAGQPIAVLLWGTSEESVSQLLQRSLLQQGALSLVILGMGVVLALGLARAIAQPILRLNRMAQQLAEGNLQVRAEGFATDEIGELAQSFNHMADSMLQSTQQSEGLMDQHRQEAERQRQEAERLQKRVLQLLIEIDGARQGDLSVRARVSDDEMGSVADAFNATLTSLQTLVLQVQDMAQQVSLNATRSDTSMNQLAEAAFEQAESIRQALDSVDEMVQSIQTVAGSAAEAATIAREASQAAIAGGTAMDQTVTSINQLRGSVAETSKKVKRLTESSQEISKIVGLISEISAKTNLLAFNASIEAVRAGEHGQGFRIVADEVRRLAEQVTNATKEIEQLVTGIQLETAEVLTMMEKGTEQVVTGSQLVSHTRTTLSSLVKTNQTIDELLQSISVSTASQTQTSQSVSLTMQSVAAVAENSASESNAVSDTLKRLVTVAEQLRVSIARFRASHSG